MKRKTVTTDFVFTGNDYKSKERAIEKETRLIANGYKLMNENSRKKTFTKSI
jgi:hypothetical protein